MTHREVRSCTSMLLMRTCEGRSRATLMSCAGVPVYHTLNLAPGFGLRVGLVQTLQGIDESDMLHNLSCGCNGSHVPGLWRAWANQDSGAAFLIEASNS